MTNGLEYLIYIGGLAIGGIWILCKTIVYFGRRKH